MRKHLLIAMAAMLGMGGVAVAQRQGPQGGPPPGPPDGQRRQPPMAMLQQELGLTDAQVSQLRKVKSEQRKAAIRRRADMAVARIELDEMLGAATVDPKALSAKVKQLSDLQAAALQARVDSRMALRQILTPEQLEKMKELRPPRGMGQGRRGRGPHGPQMPPPPGGAGPGDDEPEDDEPGEEPPSR